MKHSKTLLNALTDLDRNVIGCDNWYLFVKAFTFVFLAYWLHLFHDLNDWLGSEGFHLVGLHPGLLAPLPGKWPLVLWIIVFFGSILTLVNRTVALGSFLAVTGFFYATICDPMSAGALNMHFVFGFSVIFWSTWLVKTNPTTMQAWPVYLIRSYLIVVYFGSGWRKAIFGNWLTDPDALFNCLTGYYTTDLTRHLDLILPSCFWTFTQYATVAFELGTPLLFIHPQFRKAGAACGCLLHIGIALLMQDLFYFSFQMLTFYIPLLTPTFRLAEPLQVTTIWKHRYSPPKSS